MPTTKAPAPVRRMSQACKWFLRYMQPGWGNLGQVFEKLDALDTHEMLLALAHARLNQRAVALGHLRTALAWMRPATVPVRAASLAGLCATNPLAALSAVVVRQPDPRLDHQTNRELLGLRAEVEKGLRGEGR